MKQKSNIFLHANYFPNISKYLERIFFSLGWDYFVDIKIRAWEDFYHDWLEAAGNADNGKVIVVIFENLVSNTKAELIKMAEYVERLRGTSAEKLRSFAETEAFQQRLECVLSHSEGSFHRGDSVQGRLVSEIDPVVTQSQSV